MEATALPELVRARELARSGAARSIRLGARLSLGEVAAALDVAPSTVFRWETGERTPRGAAALRYAELLHELMDRRVR